MSNNANQVEMMPAEQALLELFEKYIGEHVKSYPKWKMCCGRSEFKSPFMEDAPLESRVSLEIECLRSCCTKHRDDSVPSMHVHGLSIGCTFSLSGRSYASLSAYFTGMDDYDEEQLAFLFEQIDFAPPPSAETLLEAARAKLAGIPAAIALLSKDRTPWTTRAFGAP